MTHILSFDCGKSNGVALGYFDDKTPYQLVSAFQFMDGPRGLSNWVKYHRVEHREDVPGDHWWDFDALTLPGYDILTVAEKFIPFPGKGFGQGLDSTLPLVGEGVLIALDVMPAYPDPRWRVARNMYLFGGKDLKQKKKYARTFLKEKGMYVMPKELGQPNSDDAVSATLHGISYLAQVLKHKLTSDMITEWEPGE